MKGRHAKLQSLLGSAIDGQHAGGAAQAGRRQAAARTAAAACRWRPAAADRASGAPPPPAGPSSRERRCHPWRLRACEARAAVKDWKSAAVRQRDCRPLLIDHWVCQGPMRGRETAQASFCPSCGQSLASGPVLGNGRVTDRVAPPGVRQFGRIAAPARQCECQSTGHTLPCAAAPRAPAFFPGSLPDSCGTCTPAQSSGRASPGTMASARPSGMSAEERRRQRELEEARKAGLAPAEVRCAPAHCRPARWGRWRALRPPHAPVRRSGRPSGPAESA